MNLNILIVDDQELNRMLLSKIATQLGHHVLLADNGREAVEKFIEHSPDLVLMDVMMPEMNGLDATDIIKSLSNDRWVPVILLSALSEQEDIVRGLRFGADDYITKPFHVDILNAKLNNFARGIAAQRQLEEQNVELRRYRFETENEKRIASHLMRTLVDIEHLQTPGVEWWLQPADVFSGDVLAAARTPAGIQHVMLADGTGHGLAAALSAQPLPEIFYAMTGYGYTIGSIAQEINRRIGRLLPVDRFFATTLVAIDTHEQMVEVWNGGNPAVMMFDQDGSLAHTFESRHLSLGIVRNNEFSIETERMSYSPGAQLVIMSDGLLDACHTTSSELGADHLRDLIAGLAPEKRLESIKQNTLAHLGGAAARDDISLFVISMDQLDSTRADNGQPRPDMPPQSEDEAWRFRLRLNGSQLRRMSQETVPFMMGALERLSHIEQNRGTLFLILSELFNNSMDHGLLGMDSQLKNDVEGFEKYLSLRSSRLASLSHEAYIEIEIEMTTDPAINITVRDSGAGFDHAKVMRRIMNAREHHGRGLTLVRSLGAELEYPGSGNEARARISLGAR